MGPAVRPCEMVDPLVGQLVAERYLVEAQIAMGGMGRIYRVRHPVLDRLLALKVMRTSAASRRALRSRFQREIRLAAAIDSPHVVAVVDTGKLDDGRPFYVMEYLDGETLADRIRRGPLPIDEACRRGAEMAHGLSAVHRADAVHRDLKPSNVMVVEMSHGPRCKLVDFGIAKLTTGERITQQGAVLGTPHYMSPEQIAARPVDARSDIYALGCILYAMVTGDVPFSAPAPLSTMRLHLEAPVPDPRARRLACPDALAEVIQRCLEKSPERRFQSADAAAEALEHVADWDDPAGPPRTTAPLGRLSPGALWALSAHTISLVPVPLSDAPSAR